MCVSAEVQEKAAELQRVYPELLDAKERAADAQTPQLQKALHRARAELEEERQMRRSAADRLHALEYTLREDARRLRDAESSAAEMKRELDCVLTAVAETYNLRTAMAARPAHVPKPQMHSRPHSSLHAPSPASLFPLKKGADGEDEGEGSDEEEEGGGRPGAPRVEAEAEEDVDPAALVAGVAYERVAAGEVDVGRFMKELQRLIAGHALAVGRAAAIEQQVTHDARHAVCTVWTGLACFRECSIVC